MSAMKIYVAADGPTPDREEIVRALIDLGHHVYDPVCPLTVEELDAGVDVGDGTYETFDWGAPGAMTAREVRDCLSDPRVVRDYQMDLAALRWADVVVLLLPSGPGQLLAAGRAEGMGKRVFAYMPDGDGDRWLSMFERVLLSEGELAAVVPQLAEAAEQATELKRRLMDDDDYE